MRKGKTHLIAGSEKVLDAVLFALQGEVCAPVQMSEHHLIDRVLFKQLRKEGVLLADAEGRIVDERDEGISNEDLDISLNLVRLRVNPDMPKLSNEFVAEHGLKMQDEIRRERTVELYNEGFRIDDLKRWKTAEVEMPKDILGIQWIGEFRTEWADAESYQKDKDGCLIIETGRTWSSKNYLYPLPSDQLQLNPNLGQNPGWEE